MRGNLSNRDYFYAVVVFLSFMIAATIVSGVIIYFKKPDFENITQQKSDLQLEQKLTKIVIPDKGVELPIKWRDFGKKMVDAGVIDKTKFEGIYENRGGLTDEIYSLLNGADNGNLKITRENSGAILNLAWAFGLSNKNSILEKGEMVDPQFGGAETFASTGGWILAKGNAMDHYSKHTFVKLTPGQQILVDNVSKGIFRPCCNNSTHFPDCNHGMAMLGLLEIMASQGMNENEMYAAALKINSYWFPDTYITIAKYLNSQDIDYKNADPKLILSSTYSSSSGYRVILNKITPSTGNTSGGCSI